MVPSIQSFANKRRGLRPVLPRLRAAVVIPYELLVHL